MTRYEALRAQVLGGGRPRTGITAFLYHGMARGLVLLAAGSQAASFPQQDPAPRFVPDRTTDAALVRLLANMVLEIESEVGHVY